MSDSLKSWIAENLLIVEEASESLYTVEGLGTLLLLNPKKHKIIDEDCCFTLNSVEQKHLEEYEIDYFLFEFGKRWYYSKLKEYTGDSEYLRYSAEFNDFKYVGNCAIKNNDRYIHLGVHSEYELLNGSGKPKNWVKKAKFLGMNALGICDKNTLAATMAIQMECRDAGIKSILGRTVPVAYDYNPEEKLQKKFDVKLYVKDKQGWLNLLKINNYSNSMFDGEFITEEILFEHSEGLILVFCKFGLLSHLQNDRKGFVKAVDNYKKHFTQIYQQVDYTEFYEDKVDMSNLEFIRNYTKQYTDHIQPILIQDSYYIEKEYFQLKEYLNKVDKRITSYSEDEHFKPYSEIEEQASKMYKDKHIFNRLFNTMLDSVKQVVDSCNFSIEVGIPRLPKYNFAPKGKGNIQYFRELVEYGFVEKVEKRGLDVDLYRKRVEIEMELIESAEIVDYFLILWDIINWCGQNDIMVGTGRGSAAGSLVCHLLFITNVDPIEYDLLFERFLNATRVLPIQYVNLQLANGSTKQIQYGTKVKTKRGEVLVEELTEDDDIDLD